MRPRLSSNSKVDIVDMVHSIGRCGMSIADASSKNKYRHARVRTDLSRNVDLNVFVIEQPMKYVTVGGHKPPLRKYEVW